MRARTLSLQTLSLQILFSLGAALSACGGPTGDRGISELRGDEAPVPSHYAFNDAGLKLFTEGVRDPMAKSLDGEKFPLFDKRQIKIDLGLFQVNRDVVTTGESWATDPVNNLAMTVTGFKRREGGAANQWQFELIGRLPFQGTVKSNVDGLGTVMDTTYTCRYEIVVFGNLNYFQSVDTVTETLVINFTGEITAIKGQLHDLKFGSGLISLPPVTAIVQDKLNEAIRDNEHRWLDQANSSLQQAMKKEELRVKVEEFYAVFDPNPPQ